VDGSYARDEGGDGGVVSERKVLLRDTGGGDTACPFRQLSSHPLGLRRRSKPIVSLAELRPPPELALIPYFCRYVKSAWDGRGYRSISE